MRFLVFSLFVSWAIFLQAQTTRLQGYVYNDSKEPLAFATVALLYPSDSTLAYFGISNNEGKFEIKYIPKGNYILQIAYLGCETYYATLELPNETDGNLGAIVLKTKSTNLSSVEITDKYIPIQFKNDTIEYNASAFRTKPDDNVEELLRKLPGVEVDRAGNIKVVGEDVVRVLVDGKEFFSTDPKVPTKNLPADAIEKVQTYDQKSDEAELTGIDDGTREKTINLVLKDDKKKAWLGHVEAGYGTDDHYMSSVKLYRFTAKHQIAFLGMANNINEFGFSFQDYMDFNGGLQNMMSSGNINIEFNSSSPVNFGQTINGLVHSQAGGFNYSYEKVKDNRFYISYLGSAYTKDLTEDVYSRNFTPGSSYTETSNNVSDEQNQNHPVSFGWKNKADSIQHFVLSGTASLGDVQIQSESNGSNYSNDTLINMITNNDNYRQRSTATSFSADYLRKSKKVNSIKLFKTSADFSWSESLDKLEAINWSNFSQSGIESNFMQYQNDRNNKINGSFRVSSLIKIGKSLYMNPEIEANTHYELFQRSQGIPGETNIQIDSLSPEIDYQYNQLIPGLVFKKSTKKIKLNFGFNVEISSGSNTVEDNTVSLSGSYLLPFFSWEKEIKTGRRIHFIYSSNVFHPYASQLNPVTSSINPLSSYTGNRMLKAEQRHDLIWQYMLFDQFSSISFFTAINGSYTKDKIGWSRIISDSLSQILYLENNPYEYSLQGMIDFSTPVKKLGINTTLKLRENWSQGISQVNGEDNINTSFRHRIRWNIEKRKHEKLDMSAGLSFEINDTRYSVSDQVSYKYYTFSYFGEIAWAPNDKWDFEITADIVNYQADNFRESFSIPLISAEMTYHFPKNKRAMLTLKGYDLLNKNTGIERTSYDNYLRESHTNIIGRFFMLSLRYRINKFNGNSGGLEIDVE